jgi:hypothetical protein
VKQSFALGIALVVLVTMINAVGQLFQKMGMAHFELAKVYLNFYLIAGIALYAVSTIIFVFALRHGPYPRFFPSWP